MCDTQRMHGFRVYAEWAQHASLSHTCTGVRQGNRGGLAEVEPSLVNGLRLREGVRARVRFGDMKPPVCWAGGSAPSAHLYKCALGRMASG